MLRKAPCLLIAATLLLTAAMLPAAAEEPVDWQMISRIRDEGFNHSKVMEILSHLTEEIGPRLTGSPQMKQANEWTRDQLAEWGLVNAHLEAYDFGRGWSFTRASTHLIEPYEMPLIALPEGWTPGTDGPITGALMRVEIESEEDLDQYRGKLAGKILMLDDSRELEDATRPTIHRLSDDELEERARFDIPGERRGGFRQRFLQRWKLRRALNDFLVEEGVVATVEISSRDGGLVRVMGGGSREPDESAGVPALVMASEHYNRLMRLLDRQPQAAMESEGGAEEGAEEAEAVEAEAAEAAGQGAEGEASEEEAEEEPSGPQVRLEIDVQARFHDEDRMAYNTVAEIPGGDLAREVVLTGAHLDSWHAGSGATDNGAGSAVMMEAMRILKVLGVRPRRTIRIALWSGEEQGLMGSRAYVEEHLAAREEEEGDEGEDLPDFLRRNRGPLTVKTDHARFAAYFNLDNGSGKIRGIYAQENTGVVPVFEAWLRPFHDLGATTVTQNNTRGTDHLAFHQVGLPGFQFVQDPLDYMSRTHHTNADTLDHVSADDLKQAAVIVASFLYHAAMRDEMLPRPPMPRDEEPQDGGDRGRRRPPAPPR